MKAVRRIKRTRICPDIVLGGERHSESGAGRNPRKNQKNDKGDGSPGSEKHGKLTPSSSGEKDRVADVEPKRVKGDPYESRSWFTATICGRASIKEQWGKTLPHLDKKRKQRGRVCRTITVPRPEDQQTLGEGKGKRKTYGKKLNRPTQEAANRKLTFQGAGLGSLGRKRKRNLTRSGKGDRLGKFKGKDRRKMFSGPPSGP